MFFTLAYASHCVFWPWLFRPSDENVEDQQRRQDAATVFRGRHHISQDDTRNIADEFEELDLSAESSAGVVEAPVHVAEVRNALVDFRPGHDVKLHPH